MDDACQGCISDISILDMGQACHRCNIDMPEACRFSQSHYDMDDPCHNEIPFLQCTSNVQDFDIFLFFCGNVIFPKSIFPRCVARTTPFT